MSQIQVRPLREDLSFGARITGVTRETLRVPAVRGDIQRTFEDRGLIIFEDVEPSSQMHVELSDVFGPLKDHPVKLVARVDKDAMPGVIDMRNTPEASQMVEVGGVQKISWLPWHFDHCYNDELNRAGVLRAIDIPTDGGLTGFTDGVELYNAMRPELRRQIEDQNILYRLNVLFSEWRFGKPEGFRSVRSAAHTEAMQVTARQMPRAVHPAVWTREDGSKVLHISPWMAEGIEGHETPQGDDLFETVSQELMRLATERAYFHRWTPTDMLVWDNWRMLHSVSGISPESSRRMQRTTIKGDYGLGRFEGGAKGDALLGNTMV